MIIFPESVLHFLTKEHFPGYSYTATHMGS